MPTQKQKKIAKLIIENAKLDNPLNGGEMLEKVSYSEGIQKQPGRVLESDGVKEELENLGFSEEGAKKVVSKILYTGKEENRIKAAQEVFKVNGSYAPEKHIDLEIEVKINTETLKIAQEADDKLDKLEDENRTSINSPMDKAQ